jgi:hypothetical protein
MEQMGAERNEELIAYSVQYLAGRHWRWQVYGSTGAIAHEGVEITEAAAERVAAALVLDTAPERLSSPRRKTRTRAGASVPWSWDVPAYALSSFFACWNMLWM